jgi:hypothetical protein
VGSGSLVVALLLSIISSLAAAARVGLARTAAMLVVAVAAVVSCRAQRLYPLQLFL